MGRAKVEKLNFRFCPQCGKKIEYKNPVRIDILKKWDDENKLCRSCISSTVMKGKTVYEVWLNKYGKEEADKRLKNMKEKQSKNFSGEKNPNYKNKSNGAKGLIKFVNESKGKTLEEIYGKETAMLMKEKISNKTSGKNNPMYGKPSPKGSGNGWSGYYKGIYFRSLLELSYLKYLMDNNIKFENGEKRKYKMQYEIDGKAKNYFPDFYLIDKQEIIEIKPYNLINSKINLAKFNAGKKLYGDKFKVITEQDIVKLTNEEIYNLYKSKDLIFDKRYEEKFEKGGYKCGK